MNMRVEVEGGREVGRGHGSLGSFGAGVASVGSVGGGMMSPADMFLEQAFAVVGGEGDEEGMEGGRLQTTAEEVEEDMAALMADFDGEENGGEGEREREGEKLSQHEGKCAVSIPLDGDFQAGDDEGEADKENMAASSSLPALAHAGKGIATKEGTIRQEEGEKDGMMLAEQEEDEETGIDARMAVGGGVSQDY